MGAFGIESSAGSDAEGDDATRRQCSPFFVEICSDERSTTTILACLIVWRHAGSECRLLGTGMLRSWTRLMESSLPAAEEESPTYTRDRCLNAMVYRPRSLTARKSTADARCSREERYERPTVG
jgi:hypothetical protein